MLRDVLDVLGLWVDSAQLPTNPLAGEESTPPVACSVPRSGLEMPPAFQAQDSDEINPGQAAELVTLD